MKYLITLLIAVLSLNAFGQMPYNPDSNGDYLIGAPDLLSFLGVYNTMLVDSSLTCDYQGTELEELFGGMYSQTLILDSVYVEYLLFDTVVTYLPGCPDPVDIEVVLERSFLITGFNYTEGPNFNTLDGQISYLGYTRKLLSYFYPSMGIYYLFIHDYEVATLTSFSKESKLSPESVSMPFPESWTLDENGVQVDWNSWSWVSNSSNFRLIPYWHEAE